MGIWGGVTAMVMVLGVTLAALRPSAAPPSATDRHDPPPVPSRLASDLAHLREEARRDPEGRLVITNDAYHAAFDTTAGVTVTPRLDGSLEPRLRWVYRAAAIERGGTRRPLLPVAPAVSREGDHVVDFVRPDLIERYAGQPGGVEQIFVLTAPPAGDGDIRISGRVAFGGASRDASRGLEYVGGGELPPLSYGEPVAFDADKRPLPVRVETADGRLDLVLDGDALATARWPVTIDPLIGVTTVQNTFDQRSIDVAYHWRRGEFLVVYDSMSNINPPAKDIRLRRYYDYGDAVAAATTISGGDMISDDRQARIDCDLHTDRCLVVWERINGATAHIHGVLITGQGVVVGSPFFVGQNLVDGLSSFDERRPRVVARNFHEHTSAETSFLVIWHETATTQADFIQYARISGLGTVLGEDHVPGSPSASTADVAYDAHLDQFLVAARPNTLGIWLRSVSPTAGHGAPVAVTSEVTSYGPRIAYDRASRRALVAWSEMGELVSFRVKGRLMTGGAAPVPVAPEFLIANGIGENMDIYPRDIAEQNGTFVVAYERFDWPSGPFNPFLRRVSAYNGAVSGPVALEFDRWILGVAVSQQHSVVETHTQGSFARIGFRSRWAPASVHSGSGDIDGDGQSDLFVHKPAVGEMHVLTQAGPNAYTLGGPASIPVLLDWDGDGLADPATYGIAGGRWAIRPSTTGINESVILGRGGDIPIAGDFLGDAKDEVGIFRPSTGEWLIRQRGTTTTTTVVWGTLGDIPVPADYDGDGKADLCVFRPSQGIWLKAKVNLTNQTTVAHGRIGDVPFAGQFVGSPQIDRAVFREGTWHIRDGATSAISQRVTIPATPLTLDWDGDGVRDVASLNDVNGTWTIYYGALTQSVVYGGVGNLPASH